MEVTIRAERRADEFRLTASGPLDISHAVSVAEAIATIEHQLDCPTRVDVDLSQASALDGSGAALLAALFARLEAGGSRIDVGGASADALALLTLVRRVHTRPLPHRPQLGVIERIGFTAASIPETIEYALAFVGHVASAIPRVIVAPASVDWRAVPHLLQRIGADALPVIAAANVLIGLVIGFLGVSQLARFGATAYVAELVVVSQFRELGPLVTAIVVAGRSGAGLASEIATMKVSEEIDALRVMGFDPVRWLVIPRCLALVIVVPILTWVGDLVALLGGLAATTITSDVTTRAYLLATADAITARHIVVGLSKSPFLALAVGLIACGQGLAAQGGSAAVGTRATAAVVTSILGVILISALFTLFFVLLGV